MTKGLERMRADLPGRLASKFEVDEAGCWIWTGARDGHGYGRVSFGGRAGGNKLAHRVLYDNFVEPVPPERELDHLCRVPACVNPDHLEPVSHDENVRRGDGGAMWREKTSCPAGHPYDAANTRRYRGHRVCRSCEQNRGITRKAAR